jgi:hypothetical protein
MTRTLIVASLMIAGCSSNGGDMDMSQDLSVPHDLSMPHDMAVQTTATYLAHTQGDVQMLTVDHGASTITLVSQGHHFTFVAHTSATPSGLISGVVTLGCDGDACTPSSAGSSEVPIGLKLHFFEVPGVALVGLPDNSSGGAFGVAVNGCPASVETDYNAVAFGFSPTFDANTTPVYGALTITGSASAPSVSLTGNGIISGTGSLGPLPTDCNAALYSFVSDASDINGTTLVGGNGVVLWDQTGSSANNTVLGFAKNTLTNADVAGHTYVGWSLVYNPTALFVPITVTLDSGGGGTAKPFLDVDTNTLDSNSNSWSTVSITGVTNGMGNATALSPLGGTYNGKMMAMKSGNIVMLVAVDALTADGTQKTNSILFSTN